MGAMELLGRRVAEEPARLGDEPAREQDQDADEDRGLEEVAHEPVGLAEQSGREREGIEGVAKGAPDNRDDLDAEDDEAPEDDEMEPPGGALLHDRDLGTDELLLSEGLHQCAADGLGNG